jgi:hypothetical protein
MNLHETALAFHGGEIAGHFLKMDRAPEGANTKILLADVVNMSFCFKGDDSFVALYLKQDTMVVVHYLQFLLPVPGLRCFWRSIQLLLPHLASRAYMWNDGKCKVPTGTAQHDVVSLWAMSLDDVMPYTPCHAFDFSEMALAVQRSGNFGRMMTFWPFKCHALRRVEKCGTAEIVNRRSIGVSQNLSVAVALAGFLRSFGNARVAINENLVKPHGAVLFAATWNVVGRAKKSVAITPKMMISPHAMYRSVAGLMGISNNESFRRLEILDYKRLAKIQMVVKANGFQHPGLYYAQSRALQLVINSKVPFDVIVRTRFDIFPAVPLRFVRMSGPDEYALDLGSSCLMDDMWWPQWARFGDGKLLKHYADTRMKYFAWQVCDWIEIGTFRTVAATARLYDWVLENNVFSAAQFVEHAFYVDQNITYQPLQLYLKILRHKGSFFG